MTLSKLPVSEVLKDKNLNEFKEKELNLIKALLDGRVSPESWKESTLYKLMHILPIPMSLVCLNGYMISANSEFQDFTGYSELELQFMRFDNFSSSEERLLDKTNFKKLITGEVSHYRMSKIWKVKNGEAKKGRLVVIRIPWPAEVIKMTEAELAKVRSRDKMGGFPVAITMALLDESGIELDEIARDPNVGNRKLFGIVPEWAIDRISRMTWSQNLSLVFVIGSLVSIFALILNFVPELIKLLMR